ncbi:putative sucrose phosphate phosphatase [Corchorus olitorius]|uniref:Sucrose phosphate phosphatase n=1 Tax=Corchorus olitorius TaxID=93759 RepID=A0A1R3KX17_9ROSI|nr:putative sucrose phosphate phosphatase [Corchorus olitorius]
MLQRLKMKNPGRGVMNFFVYIWRMGEILVRILESVLKESAEGMEGVCVVWLLWWRDCAVCEVQGEADSIIVCVDECQQGESPAIRTSWP